MNTDEESIRHIHSDWITAVNDGDLTRLLALMTDDVVFLNPGQAPSGRHDFSTRFAAAHQAFKINCISELEEVAVVGGVAYTLCQDSLTMTPRAGGSMLKLAGHRITIYRKQHIDGWRLARDAHTLTPVDA